MTRASSAKNTRQTSDREQANCLGQSNGTVFLSLLEELLPEGTLFPRNRLHGNIKWIPEQLVKQALIWSWQESKNVTDAFETTLEICEDLGLQEIAHTYTGFMNAIDRYRPEFNCYMRRIFQTAAEETGGRFWRDDGWVLMGFDGSRGTTPRTEANEEEFCAPNHGEGKTAKYRKKKSKGMRRTKNEKEKAEPPVPQVWITMMWHMALRLPWTWRLGPSNSSERGHVMDMLEEDDFPKKTLFCGDAGFVGYSFWSAILTATGDFLVRVGGNVNLLSETADVDVKRLRGGRVLCWPKGQMKSGNKPLRLRLVKVKIGKTDMWMLTSVLDRRKLSNKAIVRYYKMRWGVEVEFRGLKQTLDRGKLRCRNSNRVYAELDWSIWAMAFAELLALREQIPFEEEAQQEESTTDGYDTKDRSLANTIRALRKCMRNLHKCVDPDANLLFALRWARVQKYHNRTDKKARYRRKNPDKKPLGEPTVRKLNREERQKLKEINKQHAA